MLTKTGIVLLLLSLAALGAVRADQTIQDVQQQLKDQGFYYGEVTGEKNAETTAAIRRYQIRNGLQVTGELNEETLRSIRSNSSASPGPRPVSPERPHASEAPDASELRDETRKGAEANTPGPWQRPPIVVPPEQRQGPPQREAGGLEGVFAGTPYANAPDEVQRRVVTDAQRSLAQAGYYKRSIDGNYGAALEFSLRAYQSRVGLPVTGRLDLETLAALQLLPGAHRPVFVPGRRLPPGPPVRGEWVRP